MNPTRNDRSRLTQERVRELLDYNPETGEFHWRITPRKAVSLGSLAGTITERGSVAIGIDRQTHGAHLLAWIHQFGPIQDGERVRHVNDDRKDNRISNLHLVQTGLPEIHRMLEAETTGYRAKGLNLTQPSALPSPALARAVMDYDPETGALTSKTWWGNIPPGTVVVQRIEKGGYAQITFCGKTYHAHRFIWLHYHGEDPGLMMVDHINGDILDNRIANLRLSTHAQNQRNSKRRCNNSSGHKCVYHVRGRWRVEFKVRGCKKEFGSFPTLEEAVEVARKAREILHGEFARHA